jgi:hypothetical protein
MRRLLIIAAVVATCCWGSAAEPGEKALDDFQEENYLHIVDAFHRELLVLKVGSEEAALRIPLDDVSYSPHAVAFGNSDESNCGGISFVTQGPYLRVVDHTQIEPRAVLNVEEQYGLALLSLGRIEAASFPASDGEPLDVLYVTASRWTGSMRTPWLLVFDEQALLADPLDTDSALLAAGPLCETCDGSATDVAAQPAAPESGEQEAYVSALLTLDGESYQRFYRIVLHEPDGEPDGYWFEVTHQPTAEDYIPYSGVSTSAIGLDYGPYMGQQIPFGVAKSSSAVIDLSNGVSSCTLGGSPADLVVSSPAAELDSESYHFVTAQDGYGRLLGFPVGGCPDGGTDSIEVPIGYYPQSMVLVSDMSPTPWIYSVGLGSGIWGVHLGLVPGEEDGDPDQITLLHSYDLTEGGSLTSVDATSCFRVEKGVVIVVPPAQPDPDDPCDDPDNDDPDCDDPVRPDKGGREEPIHIAPN